VRHGEATACKGVGLALKKIQKIVLRSPCADPGVSRSARHHPEQRHQFNSSSQPANEKKSSIIFQLVRHLTSFVHLYRVMTENFVGNLVGPVLGSRGEPEHRTPFVHLYLMKGMNYMPHAEIAQIRQPSARTLLYRRLTVGRPWTPDNLCPPIHYEGMSRHFQSRGGGAPKMDTANFAPDGPYIIEPVPAVVTQTLSAVRKASAVSPICNRQPAQVHKH
jgi:hypothetical protein